MTKKKKVYEFLWRGKGIVGNSQSIDEMIDCLQSSIKELEAVKEAGLECDFVANEDDFIWFRTSDPKLAKKFKMTEVYNDEDEDF